MEKGNKLLLMELPLLSILMTSFNRVQYIVDSIKSVLASTYTDCRVNKYFFRSSTYHDMTLAVLDQFKLKNKN